MIQFCHEYFAPIIIAIGIIIATLIVQLSKRSRNQTFSKNLLGMGSAFAKNFIECKGSADYWYSVSEDAEINIATDSDIFLLAQRGWRAIDTLDALMRDAVLSKDEKTKKQAEELLQLAQDSFAETARLYSLLQP